MKNGRYEDAIGVSWFANGKRHRGDGPAIEWCDGYKAWYQEGKRHRIDGPAIEYPNGDTAWFVDGQFVDIIAVFGYLPSVPLTEEQQVILRLSA